MCIPFIKDLKYIIEPPTNKGNFFLPKIKIEIAVDDSMVDQVKNEIIKSSASGKIGDGKIFISPIDEVVRIRTGETDEDAL